MGHEMAGNGCQMRNSKLITIPGGVLVIVLAASSIAQVSGGGSQPARTTSHNMHSPGETRETVTQQKMGDTQPCGSMAPSPYARQLLVASTTMRHKVTLSWNPSTPVTNSLRDAIIGYYVYRRTTEDPSYDDRNQMNSAPLLGTKCVDVLVQAGQTYFYVTQAISASGAVSRPSNEAKAVIPDP